jgi:cytochrome c5
VGLTAVAVVKHPPAEAGFRVIRGEYPRAQTSCALPPLGGPFPAWTFQAGAVSRYTAAPQSGVVLVGPAVSKQDTHFFDVFSLVIGLLVVVAIILFAAARFIAGQTQGQEVYTEPDYLTSVEQRIQPFSREAIAGHNNAALAIVEPRAAGAAGSALPVPKNGMQAFQQVCSACHGQGIAGAPKAGDAAAWAPRIAEGKATLYQHALHGFQSDGKIMPAKGGRPDIPDNVIREAVDYMVSMVQH